MIGEHQEQVGNNFMTPSSFLDPTLYILYLWKVVNKERERVKFCGLGFIED